VFPLRYLFCVSGAGNHVADPAVALYEIQKVRAGEAV
jgi:hypothetical protein